MRLFSLFLALFLCFNAASQQPFNYGKSKNIYFLSREEIAKAGIHTIYTVSIPDKPGENTNGICLYIISFSKNGFQNGWYPYYGIPKKSLTLNQLLDSADFMNGSFYELGDDGRIGMSGLEGKGALCQNEYEHDSLFTYVRSFCKYGNTTGISKIFYYPNGLPKFSVCCMTDSSGITPETDTVAMVDSVGTGEDGEPTMEMAWHFRDTTWYVYNNKWQVIRTRTKEGSKPIFSFNGAQHYGDEPCYINKTVFERFIDKIIGYRPAMLLFEIYRNAVIAFKYDAKAKKYYEAGEISIE